ncbi:hypothetical protein GCM10010261_44960 [Streptomyces pilosus]|nr:hypothetical protein GCM10010261_44960 [Streptomyces pilosus]
MPRAPRTRPAGCGGSATPVVVAHAVVLFTVLVLPWDRLRFRVPAECKEKVMPGSPVSVPFLKQACHSSL